MLIAASCSAASAGLIWAYGQDPLSATTQENVTYGYAGGTRLQLDVYEPAETGSSRAAVILIHGGGWTDLDKSTMRPMARFLARAGFVCFSVDYRLFRDGKNTWPAQLDDVQRTVRWVRANATTYGVDPDRLAAYGHSAGAQLAALLGMEDTRDNSDPALARFSSKVRAVVDTSGPTDFTQEAAGEGAAFLTRFLGGSYASNPQAWRSASPVFHVTAHSAPFLIIHGTLDQDVPLSQAQLLYKRLRAVGVPAKLITVRDGHTFRDPVNRRTLAVETLGFLEANLSRAR